MSARYAARRLSSTFIAAIGAALVLTTALTTAPVYAAEASVKNLVLTIAADDKNAQEMSAVAKELLDRLGVLLSVRRVDRIALWEVAEAPDAAHPESARAWIDLSEASRAVLFVKDAAHDRVLLRELARTPGGDELTREELGHILQASVEGLLAGTEIGAPRAEVLDSLGAAPPPTPPAQTPPPKPTPKPERKPEQHASLRKPEMPLGVVNQPSDDHVHAWDLALYGGLDRVSATRTGSAVGATLNAELAGNQIRGLSWGASIGGAYRFPLTIDGEPVGVRLSGGLLRAALTCDYPLSHSLALRIGAGGGVDAVRIAPQSSEDPTVVRLAAPHTVWSPIARVSAGLVQWLDLWRNWGGLWMGIALDVDPNGTTYVYARHFATDVVFRPWPVRPELQIGVVL